MKRIVSFIAGLLITAASLSGQGSSAYWAKAQGPYGGKFQSVTRLDNGTMYVVPNIAYTTVINEGLVPSFGSFVYRSQDQGKHWTKLDLYQDGQPLQGIVQIGPSGDFYCLDYYYQPSFYSKVLYRSTDEGASWTQQTVDPQLWRVKELGGGVLLALSDDQVNIRRSTDYGQSWTQVYGGQYQIATDFQRMPNGDVIWPISDYTDVVLRSTDNGLNWTSIQLNQQSSSFYITPSGTFLMGNILGLRRSTDGGQNWQDIVNDSSSSLGSFVALPSGRLLASSYNGVHYSDNDGLDWHFLSDEHLIEEFLHLPADNGDVFGYLNETLYRSPDGGLSWEFASDSIDQIDAFEMAFVSPDTFFAFTPNGLWRTENKGQQWSQITDHHRVLKNKYFDLPSVALGRNHDLAVLADGKVYGSHDLGNTLSDITPPSNSGPQTVHYIPQDSTLFVSTGEELFRSTDFGVNWQMTPTPGQITQYLVRHPSGRLFAVMYHFNNTASPVRYSDDKGVSWTSANFPSTGGIANDLTIGDNGYLYLTTWQNNQISLYRSVDNGASWQSRVQPALSTFGIHDYLTENAAGNLLANEGYRVAQSLDHGLSWQIQPLIGADFQSVSQFGIKNALSPDQYLYVRTQKHGLFRTKRPTTEGAYISGTVRFDSDGDCSTADAQDPIPNWTIEADAQSSFWATTDSSGFYQMFLDTGTYTVHPVIPNAIWWQNCEGPQQIVLDSLLETQTADFSMVPQAYCPLMSVDLSIPHLRRCIYNGLSVQYCNQSPISADSAWVDVTLDPFTEFVNASLPAQDLGDNTYRFYVGTVAPAECGQFSLTIYLSCDSTILGQTHCFSAHAFPDTLCTTVPQWSGATIQAQVTCQDTVVHMGLKNVGSATSQALDFIIIVDDVVLMEGTQIYAPEQEIDFNQPANGHTWRIESQQEPGHPFATNDHLALAFAEGCGGFESLGFINQFPVDEFAPSYDRECVQSTAAVDPNDKEGLPLGTGPEHVIRANQDIEYMIRFQNTGNDTAFTVVIRDTLSSWLDPAGIRAGAASHPYTWELSGPGILQFTFNNILLPDSTVNEAGSHGFVSFRIPQQPDLPNGTKIRNEAGIYFDFNAPVLTNQTLHTVGIPVSTGTNAPNPSETAPQMVAAPNPAYDQVVIRPSSGVFKNHRVIITDGRGMVVRQVIANGPQCPIERKSLPQGLYFFQVEKASGQPEGSGSFLFAD